MKQVLLTSALALAAIISHAQTFYQFEAGKTQHTKYTLPYVSLGAGYRYKFLSAEGGLKTNWNEYYTLAYAASGFTTTGKLLLTATGGVAWMLNIPQQDRHGDVILTQGYTNQAICYGYGNVKAGYAVFKRLQIFGSVSYAGRYWYGAGVRLSR